MCSNLENTSKRRSFSSSVLGETVGAHSTTLRAVLQSAAARAHASSVAGVWKTVATETHIRMSDNVARSPGALMHSSHRCPTCVGLLRGHVGNGPRSLSMPTCIHWMRIFARTSGEWWILVKYSTVVPCTCSSTWPFISTLSSSMSTTLSRQESYRYPHRHSLIESEGSVLPHMI